MAETYTLPRRRAVGLVYRKARGKRGRSALRAALTALRGLFARKRTRTVPVRRMTPQGLRP